MPSKRSSTSTRFGAYLAAGLAVSVLTAVLKAGIAWAAESYLYTLPWVGGLLNSLELAEISNVLIFALLGLGFGAATYWVDQRWDGKLKLLPLIAVAPLVFVSSYWVRYGLWIQRVAIQYELSAREAKTVTSEFLDQATGQRGFWGFYCYSTQVPHPPTRLGNIVELSQADETTLSAELSDLSGVDMGVLSLALRYVGWGIRWIYMILAGVTAVIYYFKGQLWAIRKRA